MPEPTMNPRLDLLLSRAADEAATAQEWRELEALLAAAPAARRRYVQMMDLHAELRARHVKASSPAAAPGLPESRGSFAWLSWRPITAAAAGIVLGMICTSVVFAYTVPKLPAGKTKLLPLADAGFESGSPVPARGIPARAGVWSGDFSRVVKAELGVTPMQGQRMLRFLRADSELSATSVRSYVGEAAQVIDLRPLRADIAGGAASVELSALFNSIPSAVGERYEFAVKTAAFRGDMAEAPRMWTERDACVSRAERASIADGDPATWQRVSVPLAVPEDADFLVIECAVVRKLPRVEHAAVEFPGQYVDQVELRLSAPEKSSIGR